jgi:hypothetical protein
LAGLNALQGLLKNMRNGVYVILSEAKNLWILINYKDEILRPTFGEAQNDTFSTRPSG